MSVRAQVAVGAQYAGAGLRLTVAKAGADDVGAWAFVVTGKVGDTERVRLRIDEPYVLRDGTTLMLVAVAPPPHPPMIALQITPRDEQVQA